MDATKKRVAIVGASSLAACKHALGKGFRPVVFDADDGLGGVWRHTLASTRLQTPAFSYRFSDFPWPANVTTESLFPLHSQVVEYLAAYARRFGVLECIRFRSKVLAVDYAVAAPEEVAAAAAAWAGNGEAFGDGTGEWVLTVQHRGREPEAEVTSTQIYKFDFLILCIGRFSGVAYTPTFPPKEGPQVFHGRVLHSMDYSSMAHAEAAELVKGKRVVVVGAGKSAFDTAAECANANGARYPCAMICRNPRWMVNGGFVWGVSIGYLFTNRLAELMVHKPGQGLALSFLATLLTPLRWLISKLAEAHYKMHIPMGKHDMVPESSFSTSISACRLGVLPDKFYDKVKDGSIVIKRSSKSFSFCADGLVLHGTGERVEADVVVLATGFRGDKKLKDMFVSPSFGEMVAAGCSDNTAPLYRQCVHPRIPQLAIIGYSDSLIDGAFRLPSIGVMERSVAEWAAYARRHGDGGPCFGAVNTWYNDQLCRDMGYASRRKKGFLADWLEPYGSADYAGIQ